MVAHCQRTLRWWLSKTILQDKFLENFNGPGILFLEFLERHMLFCQDLGVGSAFGNVPGLSP